MNEYLKLPSPAAIERKSSKSDQLTSYSQNRDYDLIQGAADKCQNKVFLLLVVRSVCEFKARRAFIRSTWGNENWAKSHLNVETRLLFLLGSCASGEEKRRVLEEGKHHNDMLQWDFRDELRNLTLKDLLFFQWFTRECRDARWVYKGDDDVFVHTPNLIRYLRNGEFPGDFVVGNVMLKSPRITRPHSRYHVPNYLYPRKFYPPYVSGGCNLMGGPLVVKLLTASLTTRIYPMDDAFVGSLMTKIGVSPDNDGRFKVYRGQSCDLSRDLACHRVQ